MSLTFITVMFALLLGAVLGSFYFAGLWLTLRRLPNVRQRAILIATSFVTRTVIVLLGFSLIVDYGWQGLALSLVGFVAARSVLVRRVWGSAFKGASR